jgi:hypothetical protein
MDPKERAEYGLAWAKSRAHQRVVNGVYILISKEPHFLKIGIDDRPPHLFSAGTQADIDKAMVKEFKEGRFDEGLNQALNIIEERLAKGKQPVK